MKKYISKYKHGSLMIAYGIIYILIFAWLEKRPVSAYHVIHTVFDDMIPFCEAFIIPYMLWFPYVIGTVAFFVFFGKKKSEYYQLSLNLMMGMTIFLFVSYIFPNCQHLRPTHFVRSNVLVDMVRWLYATDTPTNILPSIHVFNSLAVHTAIAHSEQLREKKLLQNASFFLCISIILATMFLKQHSVVDVTLGSLMSLFGYLMFYPQDAEVRLAQGRRSETRKAI